MLYIVSVGIWVMVWMIPQRNAVYWVSPVVRICTMLTVIALASMTILLCYHLVLKKWRQRHIRLTLFGLSTIGLLWVIVLWGYGIVVNARQAASIASSISHQINGIRTNGINVTDSLQALGPSTKAFAESSAFVIEQVYLVRPLFGLHPDGLGAIQLLDAATLFALALDQMTTSAQPLLETWLQPITDLRAALTYWNNQQEDFVRIDILLKQVNDLLAWRNFGEVNPVLLEARNDLFRYSEIISPLANALALGPTVLWDTLGFDQPRTYLVLPQNSDELRPSGGYISTYGWFTISQGQITSFDYQPTTNNSPMSPTVDHTFQPIPEWWLSFREPIYAAWDGSWEPDFRLTAQMAQWFYEEGHNPPGRIDGVIGLDLYAFESLLESWGPVLVGESSISIDQTNFRQVIYDIRALGAADLAHKTFLTNVYRTLMVNLKDMLARKALTLEQLDTVRHLLEHRHIALYIPRLPASSLIHKLNWDGSIVPETGSDYIFVADANLGNKSSRSVARSIFYRGELLENGSFQSRLNIQYAFLEALALNDPAHRIENFGNRLDYMNLMQIMLPLDIEILGTEDLTWGYDLEQTDSLSRMIAYVETPYDGNSDVTVSYQRDSALEIQGRYRIYRLLIQRQMGMESFYLNIELRFPSNNIVIAASGFEQTTEDTVLVLTRRILVEQNTQLEIILE